MFTSLVPNKWTLQTAPGSTFVEDTVEPEVPEVPPTWSSSDKPAPSPPPGLSAWPQSTEHLLQGGGKWHTQPRRSAPREGSPHLALSVREALPLHKWPPEGWWMPHSNPFHPRAKFPDSHTIDDPPLEIPTDPGLPTASQGCPGAQ